MLTAVGKLPWCGPPAKAGSRPLRQGAAAPLPGGKAAAADADLITHLAEQAADAVCAAAGW